MKTFSLNLSVYKRKMLNVAKFATIAVTINLLASCHQEDITPQTSPNINNDATNLVTPVMLAVPSGGDSQQRGCKLIQDRANELLEEYRRPGTSGARLEEIRRELQSLGQNWNDIGCKSRFGDIFRTIPTSPRRGPIKLPVPVNPVAK